MQEQILQNGISFAICSETLASDEEASIKTYKGYYIGRYEAGDKESTESETLRTNSTSDENTVTIKKGQAPYNWITRDQIKDLAEKMATEEKYKATTKLVSSYAWDTAINFIQETNSDYGTLSGEGNYSDTEFDYIDIKGDPQLKAKDSSLVVPTGQTTPVNNIYDLGGNVREWTTEKSSKSNYPYVSRGGCYADDSIDYSAGFRNYTTTIYNHEGFSFRVALFM